MGGRTRLERRPLLIRASISLRPGEDDDLIQAFERIPARKRAAFIKAAMRSGGLQGLANDGLPGDDDLEQSIADFLS